MTGEDLVAGAGTEVQILNLPFAPELILDDGLEQTEIRGRVDLGHLDTRNAEVLLARLGIGGTIIHEGVLIYRETKRLSGGWVITIFSYESSFFDAVSFGDLMGPSFYSSCFFFYGKMIFFYCLL